MKILKWAVVVLVGLALLIVAGVFVRNKAVGPAGWARDNTLKQLKANLRNPGSMVIRSSYIVKTADPGKDATVIELCGVVDAKDAADAYTGGLRFVSRSIDDNAAGTFDTYAVLIEDPAQKVVADSQHVLSTFEARYWNAHCVDAAHPPLLPAT
ncbi:hypothetical protein [Massilia sp. S19_KUP03_FR1]|uniref:hypothetical protein n=1 Tax=Massilia sp. S19_KUP03_FR1 TaxID=3025503 RepID=UPI002FCDB1B3